MNPDIKLVVIPAYNPPATFPQLVLAILGLGIDHVIIVNDGSSPGHDHLFARIKDHSACVVLNHEINQGKGIALKTAFQYVIDNFSGVSSIVMADADSQHSPADILGMLNQTKSYSSTIVLGARTFNRTTPLANRVGNFFSNLMFTIINRSKLTDTQTGLRGLTTDILPELIKLPGAFYDYEINMLLYARQLKIKIVEQPIAAIYIAGENPSHFSPATDTFKIFVTFLNYAFGRVRQRLYQT